MTNRIMITRSSMPPFEEYIDEIRDIWESHWLTNMGVKHERLRALLKQYLDVDNIELLTNGHMAIELSLQALGLTSGEVITTPYTFASTTHAIVRNGLTPVFCDINPDTLTMDESQIEGLITDKTVAILPVHVYGCACNIEEIDRIAKRHGLKVIYDAAHTFGETYNGKGIGSFGDVSCFSFHATKVFNTIEGGAVCFKDEEFGKSIYRLKNFGIRDEETVDGVGANAKMNEFCAAMGLCNLKHIDDEIKKRKHAVERYRIHLEGVKGIQLVPEQSNVKSNYSYFPIIINEKQFGVNRDEVFSTLAKNGIGARKYFYPLTSSFDCYRGIFNSNLTPVALYVSKSVLTLPLYAGLSDSDIDRICGVVIECKQGRKVERNCDNG